MTNNAESGQQKGDSAKPGQLEGESGTGNQQTTGQVELSLDYAQRIADGLHTATNQRKKPM